MALQSKFPTNHAQRHRITHFLAIPFVTPKPRLQVLDSFKCLWDNLAAIGVPTNAIRSPGLLHLSLRILLRLDPPERMAKAREILEKVSNKEALRTIHGSSTPNNLFRNSSMAPPTANNGSNSSMAPPRVSICSLFTRPGMEAKAFRLSAIPYDATNRVSNIIRQLTHAYQAADLSPKARPSPNPQVRVAINSTLGSCGVTICLVTIPQLHKLVPSNKYPGKLVNQYLPPSDARGLLERYRDHVMEHVPLERVSICKIGFQKMRAEMLPEVFSVPLS